MRKVLISGFCSTPLLFPLGFSLFVVYFRFTYGMWPETSILDPKAIGGGLPKLICDYLFIFSLVFGVPAVCWCLLRYLEIATKERLWLLMLSLTGATTFVYIILLSQSAEWYFD
jgi:hypothetical protein